LTNLPIRMAFLFTLLFTSSSNAALLEMADLIAHPAHYDRKGVVVTGKVTNVQPVNDRDGNPAFKFLLEDGAGIVKVITRTEVQEGDHVIVEGVFSRRRQGGRIQVYNEVDATSVRPVNRLTPDLVG
jgi:hypothetical protein